MTQRPQSPSRARVDDHVEGRAEDAADELGVVVRLTLRSPGMRVARDALRQVGR
jgi:hypothetical protein